ncbi:DUF732 domain-containing protein [Pseudarthrobacter sp. ATCC 49987]|uniref:DUF732 domain-containing protein n=1 Tax=Pseudarthrobacter sp. ATCC 49987 TaxID=2698204 RepID=UPI001370633B|nr:DUF732 domain-containing protein [Pseudarthrobacter sp. ATCC 49987]
MKKTIALLGCAAVLMTGCAAQSADSAPSSSPAPASPSSSSPPASPVSSTVASAKSFSRQDQINAIYLKGIRSDQPALGVAADADLISIGQGLCKLYEGGAKGTDVNHYILTAAGWAYTVPQLVSMHGAAVGAFCPQYIDKMGL